MAVVQLPIHRDIPDALPPDSPSESVARTSDSSLRVGDLAKQTGKTVRALHLYEELGLLVPAHRSKGGFRLYHADSVVRVRWIGKLQDMGFSLTEIRQVLTEWERSGSRSAPEAMQRI